MTAWRRKEEIGLATLYLGDQRDVLEERAEQLDGCVIITDPPYSSGGFQDAGKGGGSIGTAREVLEVDAERNVRRVSVSPKIAGDTYSTRGYLRLMRTMLQATKASECYVFTDWRMWVYTFDAVEDGGFRVRNMIVWNKGYAGMGVKWKAQHELICWGARRSFEPGWGQGNVLTVPRSGNIYHPTEKPVLLIEMLLAACLREQVILDPFLGSGSTGVAAINRGHKFVGIEIDEAHFATACQRIDAANKQPRLIEDPAPEQTTMFAGGSGADEAAVAG